MTHHSRDTIFLGQSAPDRNGMINWRFRVAGPTGPQYYTIQAPNRAQAEHTLGENLASAVIGGGVALALGYALVKAWQWWKRDDQGPGSFGFGFGSGNGGINLNPFDKGKAATGDGAGELDPDQWERRTVAGVEGWRRKGIALPNEEGGPASYQAAVLVMGDGSAIPDVASWPDTLPVFFVHDAKAPYPDVDGGWLVTATFGGRKAPGMRIFDCNAKTSAELKTCVKATLEDSLMVQWV